MNVRRTAESAVEGDSEVEIPRRFRLGDLEIRRLEGIVVREGVQYPLQKKAMEVLGVLAVRAGEVVSRQDLIDLVWNGRATTDDAINRCISAIRTALGDSRSEPSFIDTVHGRGYRCLISITTDTPASTRRYVPAQTLLVVGLMILVIATMGVVALNRSSESDGIIQFDGLSVLVFELVDEDIEYAGAFPEVFRQSLRQSQTLRILPEFELRSAFVRLFDAPETPISRSAGLRVAQDQEAEFFIFTQTFRDGAKLVMRSVVSRPDGNKPVTTISVDATNAIDLMAKIGDLTERLRQALGESRDKIVANRRVINEIASADPVAMSAYAKALDSRYSGQLQDAIDLAHFAIQQDPEFALAHALLGRLYYGTHAERALTQKHLALALEHQSRLSPFEVQHVVALQSYYESPQQMLSAWRLLRNLDDSLLRAHYELGNVYWKYFNDFENARAAYQGGVDERRTDWVNLYHLGYAQLGLGDVDSAIESFEQSRRFAGNYYNYGMVDALVAARRYADAESLIGLARNNRRLGPPNKKVLAYLLFQGKTQQARDELSARLESIEYIRWPAATVLLSSLSTDWLNDTPDSWADSVFVTVTRIVAAIEDYPPQHDLPPFPQLALFTKMAARAGHVELATQLFDAVTRLPDYQNRAGAFAHMGIAKAEILIATGEVESAVTVLQRLIGELDLFQAHDSLAFAYQASGSQEQSRSEYAWLVGHRGRVLAESGFSFGRSANVAVYLWAVFHLAELEEQIGDPITAAQLRESLVDDLKGADAGHYLYSRLTSTGRNAGAAALVDSSE
ncbi:MAG: winged helix-turn-helix domain-containing protein [Pseudomonadota bacterium]